MAKIDTNGRQGARDRIRVFFANLATGSPMYGRTSKDTHLETVCCEMDMGEFSYQEFMKKPRQYTKVFVENKAPHSTAEPVSIQSREEWAGPLRVIAMRSG